MQALGRCMQRAAGAENAALAMQATATAGLTSLTQPTMVVNIPQQCRQLQQLRLEQVVAVVVPAAATVPGDTLEARNADVFSSAQRHSFAGALPLAALTSLLQSDIHQGPPELQHAHLQPADPATGYTAAGGRRHRWHR